METGCLGKVLSHIRVEKSPLWTALILVNSTDRKLKNYIDAKENPIKVFKRIRSRSIITGEKWEFFHEGKPGILSTAVIRFLTCNRKRGIKASRKSKNMASFRATKQKNPIAENSAKSLSTKLRRVLR